MKLNRRSKNYPVFPPGSNFRLFSFFRFCSRRLTYFTGEWKIIDQTNLVNFDTINIKWKKTSCRKTATVTDKALGIDTGRCQWFELKEKEISASTAIVVSRAIVFLKLHEI